MKPTGSRKIRLAAAALCVSLAACGEANDDSDVIIVDPPGSTTISAFATPTSTIDESASTTTLPSTDRTIP